MRKGFWITTMGKVIALTKRYAAIALALYVLQAVAGFTFGAWTAWSAMTNETETEIR